MNTCYSKEKLEEIIQSQWDKNLERNDAGVKRDETLMVFAKSKPLFKGGKEGVLTEKFDLLPIKKENAEIAITKKKVVLAYADILLEEGRIGVEIQDHINQLKNWLDKKKEDGYIIEWSIK